MNFFSKTSHKILIAKRLFYGFLITSLLVVILIIISGLLSLISQEQFNLFVVQKKLENVSTNDAFNQFRFETLIKIFTNSIVIIFFAIYVFFAHTKIKIGYIFVTF